MLTCLAVTVKIFSTLVIGLIFSRDIATYTSIVSRTYPVSFRLLFFILTVDLVTLVILTQITKVFFTVSESIKAYILFSTMAVLIFWLSDVMFIVEIKSGKLIHHFFTLLLILNKYIVFMLLSIAYILQMYKIQEPDKQKIFLDYRGFKYKRIIKAKLFSYSRVLYKNGISVLIYILLTFYTNFLSLYLYRSTVLFFLNIIICGAILFYLILIAFHQLNIIISIYKKYPNQIYKASPTVAMPTHKAS